MGRPRLVSDDQILSVMRARVLEDGPNVPLDAVAADLGVSVPAVLKRFGTRQALMLRALRPEAPEFLETLHRGPDGRPLQEQLYDLFVRMTAFLGEAVPCLVALRESGIPLEMIYKERGPLQTLAGIQRWLKLAKRRGLVTVPELDSSAFAILGALQGRIFFSHMTRSPLSPRAQGAYARELARFFARALSPDGSRASDIRPGRRPAARRGAP